MTELTKIANYEITGRLGNGGMGDVYKAVQLPLERPVALKVSRSHENANEEARKRFETEAKAIGKLDHRNIVSLYDYGEENGLGYFAMQLIEGPDLFSVIKKTPNLPFSLVVEFGKQIARGLLYAHNNGVIHRDIKPHNILTDPNRGICKITDFGIAHMFQSERVTMTGMAIGTPEYMSPEQAAGKELDAQTDVYSFGILLYEMCAGIPPFMDSNPITVAYKQVNELPEPPSKYRKDIPKRLELIIMKALKKDKKERYTSMAKVLDDLDSVEVKGETSLFNSLTPSDSPHDTDERRITDRRRGDRRQGNRRDENEGGFNPLSLQFWLHSLRQQWLTVALVIGYILYSVFVAK